MSIVRFHREDCVPDGTCDGGCIYELTKTNEDYMTELKPGDKVIVVVQKPPVGEIVEISETGWAEVHWPSGYKSHVHINALERAE